MSLPRAGCVRHAEASRASLRERSTFPRLGGTDSTGAEAHSGVHEGLP